MVELNLENLINKMNSACRAALEQALGMVLEYQQETAEIEHFLYQLLLNADAELLAILHKFNISTVAVEKSLLLNIERLARAKVNLPTLGQNLIDLINKSWQMVSIEFNKNELSSGFILLALLTDIIMRQRACVVSPVLKKLAVDELKVYLKSLAADQPALSPLQHISKSEGLDKYAINLITEAHAGKIDAVIGRENEIRQMIDILMRRRQNNPILTGEPGVGKTAIVEGLALRIAEGRVPNNLINTKIYSLDLGLLQAGAGVKGEFERRLKSLITDIEKCVDPVILFIDEAHTLIGAGGAPGQMDAANILKPALARGGLRVIAATTWSEYKQYIETDAALTRRFQVVNVRAPDEQTAKYMLRSMVGKLEQHHQVTILASAVDAAVELGKRYLTERQLPDSAISVLDTACARVHDQQNAVPVGITALQEERDSLQLELQQLAKEHDNKELQRKIKKLADKIVAIEAQVAEMLSYFTEEQSLAQQIINLNNNDNSKPKKLAQLKHKLAEIQKKQKFIHLFVDNYIVAEVIANWTGIPAENMLRGNEDKVLSLPQRLKQKIIGQEVGLGMISNKLLASGAKLIAPNKPTAVFLLVGPSGVGKTETANVLAEEIFGSKNKMTIINMSEFKEAHKVATLIGSPPGYVGYGKGGVLTEAIRREPYSLILLDEIEKAHPSVQELFFQMFDKGILTDSEGRDVDCKNTIIVMTSNAADEFIESRIELKDYDFAAEESQQALSQELTRFFAPAFLGRTTIVPYLPLTDSQLNLIIERELKLLNERAIQNYNVKLEFAQDVNNYLTAACNQQQFGARQIYNNISQQLLPVIAAKLLQTVAAKKSLKKIMISRQEDTWLVI
jgi:type VI secretion system protein VasG